MDINVIGKKIQKKVSIILLLSIIIGSLAAGISTMLPDQYTAKGLIAVIREVEAQSENFFTYEGYYALQNTQTYLSTIETLLQSPENISSAFEIPNEDLDTHIRKITVRKKGPQLLELAYKDSNPKTAEEGWVKLTKNVIRTHESIKENADRYINVFEIDGSPVLLSTYPKWYKVFAAGFLLSIVTSISILALNYYLREER